MLDEVRQQVETTVVPLLKGILEDTQTLLRQEIALAKVELRADARRAGDAAISFGGGVVAAVLAALLFAFALVHGLVAIFPGLALWGAYAIVAVLCGIIGGSLLGSAITKAKRVRGIPEKTVDSMRENVQWIQGKV